MSGKKNNQPIKHVPSVKGFPPESFSQNQPLAGMVSDGNINVEGLTPNEYSFALNSRLNAYSKNGLTSGELGAISNDMGNVSVVTLPQNYLLIASVYLKGASNEFCLFLYNPTTTSSQIGILSDRKAYTTVIDTTTCLGFTDQHSIKGVSTLYKSSDRMVFWTDNNNKPKYINLDNLDVFKDSTGNWICDAFNTQRSVNVIPELSLNEVYHFGGLLDYGTYMFFVRYVDASNNSTNWISHSNQIPILDTRRSSAYGFVTGSYNASSELDRYGNQTSNNTIVLDITSVDTTNFTHYQLGVLEYIGGIGVATNAYVLKKQFITSTSEKYTYTGNTTLIDAITTQDEFIVPTVRIDKAASIETEDNRILYANTRNKRYDWGKFQVAANTANLNYVITKVRSADITQLSTKNEAHYDKSRSLMRDEVYALGIVYYMNDIQTPVFHLAGRESNYITAAVGNAFNTTNTGGANNTPDAITNWDTDVITGNDTTSFGTNPPRWQVYNTAVKTNSLVGQTTEDGSLIVASGDLGYYEATNVKYPTTKDDSGALIYPNTAGVMSPVRHHRMPDTNLEPHASDDGSGVHFIYPLGVHVTGVTIPAEYSAEVTGYAIVIANKNDVNDYTIIDKAMMTTPFISTVRKDYFWARKPTLPKGEYITHSIPFTKSNGFQTAMNIEDSSGSPARYHVGLDTPQSKFNTQNISFDYLKLEGLISTGGQGLSYRENDDEYFRGNANLHRFERFPTSHVGDLNYTIKGSTFVTAGTATSSNALSTSGTATNDSVKGFQGNAQSGMFAALYNENPFYVNNYGDVGDETYGNIASFNIYAYYASLKNNITDLHSNLEALVYRRYSQVSTITSGVVKDLSVINGDTFITRWDVRRSIQNPTSDEYTWKMTKLNDNTSALKKKHQAYISSNMSFYVESRINTEYRNLGEKDYETYFLINPDVLDPTKQRDGNVDVLNEDEYVLQEDFQDYNIDYSNLNDIYPYFPISDSFDARYYTNDLRYRIWYTERYINGDISDNRFRILANSYTELDIDNADQTGITDIFIYNDELYAHTSKTMFALPTNPQQLQSNENTIFIGQGDFLKLPPKAYSTVAYGYAGSNHFSHKVVTEQGVLFVDINRLKVFLFNDKLEELNNKKQNMFFKYNLECKFLNAWYDVVGTDNYVYKDASQSPMFVGYVLYYDKIYNRLMLTKRDFSFNMVFSGLLSTANFKTTVYNNALFYDDTNNYFVKVTSSTILDTVFTRVDFSDKTVFTNNSFTMSFGLQTGLWTSFHSYTPNHVLEDSTTFYSWNVDSVTSTSNDLWAHGDEHHNTNIEACSYYNNKYPHIVEFTVIHGKKDTINQHTFNAVNYMSAAHQYDSITGFDRLLNNRTFNEFCVYNSYQHSGLLNLKVYDKSKEPYKSIELDTTTSLAYNTNLSSWNVNSFRDISTEDINLDIHSTSWNDLSSYYVGTQGYMDKVPTNIDYNKNVYKRRRFKDRFARIRLIYDYNNILDTSSDLYGDVRLTTNIVLTNTTNTKLK